MKKTNHDLNPNFDLDKNLLSTRALIDYECQLMEFSKYQTKLEGEMNGL